MECSGSYEYPNRTCSLCRELNHDNYLKCQKETMNRKKFKDAEVIEKFFEKHCKYALDYRADGEDYIACTLEDACDGYYPNCTPFEYDCIHERKEVTDGN